MGTRVNRSQVASDAATTKKEVTEVTTTSVVETSVKRIKLINKVDKLTGVIQFTGNVSVTIADTVKVQKAIEDEDGLTEYVIQDGNTFCMPFSVLLACLHNNCKQKLIQPIITYYLGKLSEYSTNDIGLELSMLMQDSRLKVAWEIKTLEATKDIDTEHQKISYELTDIVFVPTSLEKPVTLFNHLFKGLDATTANQVARKQLRLGDEPEFLI